MTETIKAVNLSDGAIYYITPAKLKKESTLWKLYVEETKETEYTYSELKDKLTELGVEFKGNATKKTLQELLDLEGDII